MVISILEMNKQGKEAREGMWSNKQACSLMPPYPLHLLFQLPLPSAKLVSSLPNPMQNQTLLQNFPKSPRRNNS